MLSYTITLITLSIILLGIVQEKNNGEELLK
jgi:hypothetical protein